MNNSNTLKINVVGKIDRQTKKDMKNIIVKTQGMVPVCQQK